MIREIVTKIKSSTDAKVLTGNFFSLSILQLIGYIFPLITLPYLAKVLGAEKFGIIAFAVAVMAYFQAFVDFGFNYTAVRDIAKQKGDIQAVSRIFSTVMTIRVLFAFISFLVLLILIFTIPLFKNNRQILLLTYSYIPCYILFPEWFFQAMEKMKFITIMNVLSKVIFTSLVFIVIRKREDYILQPVLNSMGYLIAGLISIVFIINKFKVTIILPNLLEIRTAIKNGFDMFLNIFLPNLYTNFSTILLRGYAGEAATGIFDAGNRFIGIAQQITNVLSRTFFPFLARRMDHHKIYRIISFSLSIIISLTLFFGAGIIIRIFYTPEFEGAITVLRILSLSIVFLFFMNAFGTNYLVLVNQERLLRKIIIWCSLFGFVFSWIAIIFWGYVGAAITYLTVWGVRGIITWRVAIRIKMHNG